tara:strand:+ start:3033 stop:3842 length:810 start_codon:yes stop_codon:yes gene_type:complete
MTAKYHLRSPASFFNYLTSSSVGLFPGGMSQKQVDTVNAIIEQMRDCRVEYVAYTLATAYHEPGPKSRMIPNRESLYYTTASRIRKVWPSRFPSLASATPFVRSTKALANKVYNGRLGNKVGSNDGYFYRGGGLDHLTGREHYETESARQNVNLVSNPDLILDPKIAVSSLVHGMTTGRYREWCLEDFVSSSGFDYVQARNIVNADAEQNGELIAGHARKFEAALKAGGYEQLPLQPVVPAVPVKPKPITESPVEDTWFNKILRFFGFI